MSNKAMLLILVCSFSFLQMDCKDDPPVIPPTSQEDTIITFEKVLTDGEQPAVSPDGRKIAFSREGDIWIMDTSGANQTQLTTGAGLDILPGWNPNGQTVGFVRKNTVEDNKGFLFSVPLTGGDVSQLILNQNVLIDGLPNKWEWSPDGKYVALISHSDTSTRDYLHVVMLSNNATVYTIEYYTGFAWSLNLNEIGVIIRSTEPNKSGDTWLVNVITKEMRKDSLYFEGPRFLCRSPLSNKFAYNSFDLASVKITVTDFSNHPIEYYVSSAGGLKWSPDEKNFIYEFPIVYPNPYGYRMSRIAIYNTERRKEFLLTKEGDVNRFNTFFEWGSAPNEVYFERYKKINKVAFQLPK